MDASLSPTAVGGENVQSSSPSTDDDLPSKSQLLQGKEAAVDSKVSSTEVANANATNLTILQLEDATLNKLPTHVELILSQIDLSQSSQTEMLIALIYCLAIECGFVAKSVDDIELHSPIWACTFHAKNVLTIASNTERFYSSPIENFYRIDLKLPTISDKLSTLVIIRTGECLLVTLTPHNCRGYSVCLSLYRFVLANKAKEFSRNFRNLPEFAFLLRERILIPARNALIDNDNNSFPGLSGLPTELIIQIIKYLKLEDLQSLSKTCKRLRVECEANFARRPKKRVRAIKRIPPLWIQSC